MGDRSSGSVLTCQAPEEDPAAGREPAPPAQVRHATFGSDDELFNDLPPSWTLQRFQSDVTGAMKEYFVALTVEDSVVRLRELLADCPGEADELAVVAVRAAIDRDEAAQRAIVELFSALHRSSVLQPTAVVRAMEKLFCTWEDIAIDAPKAPQAILAILIGCIGNNVVSRDLLTKLPEGLMKAGLSKPEFAEQLGDGKEMLATSAAELKEFKTKVSSVIDEYFVALSIEEAKNRLEQIGMKPYLHEFVKKAIVGSFSHQDPAKGREAVLTLFDQLTRDEVITKDDLQWGVTRLLAQLEDLALDCPHASDLAVELLASLVGDELISVLFLRRCRQLRIGGTTGLRVLDTVQRRTPEYCKKHLGTQQFKKELHTMIIEYFNSGDEAEFGRCVRDLAPLAADRSAELIRKVMALAMERGGAECEQALKLLVWLCRHEEITPDALERGFDDLYRCMPDLLLDVPDAEEMARAFVVEAKKAKVLRREWPDPAEQ